MTKSKGSRHERELSNLLEDEFGYAALRAGSSGSATARARPDVLATRPDLRLSETSHTYAQVYAIELKAWHDGTGQLDEAEVTQLMRYAHRAGGTALVVVRPSFNRFDDWHVYQIHHLNRTDAGNYSIRQSERPGRSLEDVLGPKRGGAE